MGPTLGVSMGSAAEELLGRISRAQELPNATTHKILIHSKSLLSWFCVLAHCVMAAIAARGAEASRLRALAASTLAFPPTTTLDHPWASCERGTACEHGGWLARELVCRAMLAQELTGRKESSADACGARGSWPRALRAPCSDPGALGAFAPGQRAL